MASGVEEEDDDDDGCVILDSDPFIVVAVPLNYFSGRNPWHLILFLENKHPPQLIPVRNPLASHRGSGLRHLSDPRQADHGQRPPFHHDHIYILYIYKKQ